MRKCTCSHLTIFAYNYFKNVRCILSTVPLLMNWMARRRQSFLQLVFTEKAGMECRQLAIKILGQFDWLLDFFRIIIHAEVDNLLLYCLNNTVEVPTIPTDICT